MTETPMIKSLTTKPEFFRAGGRAANALREVRLTPDYVAVAEGSVLIECGQTRVLCNATIEQGVPAWLRNSGRGWVTAEYGMLPRATLTRTPRESERGKVGGRTHEIQRLIGRSLRSAVDMKALGERTVVLDCDVLQADGGTRTAAITGACAALALALNRLVAAGTLKESPLKQLVAATSVGIVEGQVLLDLAYEEDSQAEVDIEYRDDRGWRPDRGAGDRGARHLFAGAAAGDDGLRRGRYPATFCGAAEGALANLGWTTSSGVHRLESRRVGLRKLRSFRIRDRCA